MKKTIKIFKDKNCWECAQVKKAIETADIVALNDNVELITLDIEDDKTEWEKVMKRTGVYFVPHIEVTWEGEEIHISQIRDFQNPKQAFEKLAEILKDDYKITNPSKIEMREKLKSLSFMQEQLFEHMNNAKENFTIMADYINMTRSKLKE
tara:strand:+ start:155 stop:607 length:453 start_codon:yes stop_codon:yes gene_type:complete